MINLLKAETFKLKRNKSFWMIAGLMAGTSILFHILIMTEWWMMSGTIFDTVGLGELNGLAPFTVPVFFNLAVGSLAAFFISSEFSESGVIRLQVMSGYKRSHVYFAKYLVFSFGTIIITVVIPLLTAALIAVALGHGDILQAQHFQYIVGTYGLFTLQLLGYTAIVTMLAILTEESGKTIIFSILFTVLVFVIEQFAYHPSVGWLYEHTIFHQFSFVFTPELSGAEWMRSTAVGVITIVPVLAIGMAVFNRKEIK